MKAAGQRRRGCLFALLVFAALVVAGLLAGMPEVRRADRQRASNDLRSLQRALVLYQRHAGRLPTTAEGWRALVERQVLDDVPMDPWGSAYVYRLEGDTPLIATYGADGRPGGTGRDADLSVRGLAEK